MANDVKGHQMRTLQVKFKSRNNCQLFYLAILRSGVSECTVNLREELSFI